MSKSTIGIILSRIIGFMIFIILLGIASLIAWNVTNTTYATIVSFFYDNLELILTMTIVGTIGEVFWSFSFPFNIAAPVASAFLSKYIIIFLYELLDIIGFDNITAKYSLEAVTFWVFVIVILAGYLTILVRLGKKVGEKKEREGNAKEEREKIRREQEEKWEEIGKRIKDSIKNSAIAIEKTFRKKEKGKKKKRRK